jgi:uncharacterized membrane protein YfcA
MLTRLPSQSLLLLTAAAVFIYIAFRTMRPDWRLGRGAAQALALPVGAVAGVLQGAAGLSAPISITFLNAMRLSREAFIPTISLFFAAMSCVQIPMLAGYGQLTPLRLAYGFGALAIIMAVMPLGAALAKRVSKEAFDRLILCLLALVALRLAWSALV